MFTAGFYHAATADPNRGAASCPQAKRRAEASRSPRCGNIDSVSVTGPFRISPDVAAALARGAPVVALESTVVTTEAPVPEPVLQAWSSALSDHLRTQIRIIRPNVAGSATT